MKNEKNDHIKKNKVLALYHSSKPKRKQGMIHSPPRDIFTTEDRPKADVEQPDHNMQSLWRRKTNKQPTSAQ